MSGGWLRSWRRGWVWTRRLVRQSERKRGQTLNKLKLNYNNELSKILYENPKWGCNGDNYNVEPFMCLNCFSSATTLWNQGAMGGLLFWKLCWFVCLQLFWFSYRRHRQTWKLREERLYTECNLKQRCTLSQSRINAKRKFLPQSQCCLPRNPSVHKRKWTSLHFGRNYWHRQQNMFLLATADGKTHETTPHVIWTLIRVCVIDCGSQEREGFEFP